MPIDRQPISLDTNIVQDNIPFEIIPHLFIGSKHACFNLEGLRASNITHILNISGIPPTYPKDFTYMTIEIHDKEESNLLSVVPLAMLFIDAALKNGSCLVHCVAGRSRSAAIIIAYLINKCHYSYYEAYDYVKAKRSVVTLNKGFQEQLKAYYESRCDVYVANQILLSQRFNTLSTMYTSRMSLSTVSSLKYPSLQDVAHVQLVLPSNKNTNSPITLPTLRGLQLGYHCRYCNKLLFTNSNVIRHIEIPKPPSSRSSLQQQQQQQPFLQQQQQQQECKMFELKGINTLQKVKRVSVNSDSPNFIGSVSTPTNNNNNTGNSSSLNNAPTPQISGIANINVSNNRGSVTSTSSSSYYLDPSSARSDLSVSSPSPDHRYESKTPDPLDSPAPSIRISNSASTSPMKFATELSEIISPNPPKDSPPPSPHPLIDGNWYKTVEMIESVGKNKPDFTAKSLYQQDSNQLVPNCDFIFIEPMNWLNEQITRLCKGKILCCECKKEIGFYACCSCGESITPAFSIYRRSVVPHTRDHEFIQFTETEECPGK